MHSINATQSNTQLTGSLDEAVKTDTCAEILELAYTTSTRNEFFVKVLRVIARVFASPYAAIYVTFNCEIVEEECHFGPTDPQFWKPHLQQFMNESLVKSCAQANILTPKQGAIKAAFLSAPITDFSKKTIGAIALVDIFSDKGEVIQHLALLKSLTRLASQAADMIEAINGGQENFPTPNNALIRSASVETPEELAFAITNNLRNKLGCEQVSLGMVLGRRIKILSVSGLPHVSNKSAGIQHIRPAMEECYDADIPIVTQRNTEGASEHATSGYCLHRQWQAAAKGDIVASIPLHTAGETVAVLSLRRRPNELFTDEQIKEIRTLVEPFASALHLVRKANRGILQHALDYYRDTVKLFTTPGHLAFKIMIATMVATVIWFIFGTINYRLTVPCQFVPGQTRHISAPFDGILQAAKVIEGGHVRKGDVLCQFDTRELDQQRAKILAQIAVFEREKDRAMGDDNPAHVQLSLANQKLARTQLEIIENRIQQSTIHAPFDGVIIVGDLRKAVGAVVSRGDPLFEIAPLDSWFLELHVPEADAEDLDCGLQGEFALHARPEVLHSFTISRTCLQAEARKQKNVYIAEADINLPYGWMRPGMEGSAKILVARRPVWWVVLHRAIDYLRMALWI
ncbi:MAG: efflux RND transporter periplasmic adaptor subunit [Planctomycetota bacterium]|jgi:biotin carboxyl carrier protein